MSDTEGSSVVRVEPSALIQAYSDELTQMTARALMAEQGVAALQKRLAEIEGHPETAAT